MSSIEIRRVEGAEHLPLSSYAFFPSPESRDRLRQEEERLAKPTTSVRLAAFDGDTAVASATGLPMTQNVRGRTVPMLGVGAVSADPTVRRRGHVRRLLDRLHDDFSADGYATAALWPFRPSFYEQFGYVGLSRPRSVRLFPSGFARLRKLDPNGNVTLHRLDEQAAAVADYLERLRLHRHGFALPGRDRLTDVRDDAWVAFARRDSEIVGMLIYTTEGIGGALLGRTLLYDDAGARMLLLRWLALHEDQFESFRFTVRAGDGPELWYTDAQYDDETEVRSPTRTAAMVRVLSVPGLAGIEVGEAVATVRVRNDPHVGGVWTLDGSDGTLRVARVAEDDAGDIAGTMDPESGITAQGLSALVYGVLRADELPLRGYGAVDGSTAHALNTLFPPADPFLYAQF